jgi:hypothetical protein
MNMNLAVKKFQNMLSNRTGTWILEDHGKTLLIDQEFNTVSNEITIIKSLCLCTRLLSLLVKQKKQGQTNKICKIFEFSYNRHKTPKILD